MRHSSPAYALDEQWGKRSHQNPGRDIPGAHLPKLFDRFDRVDPARQRNGESAGLGLAIVKSIVQAHRGTVSARSGDGITSFTLQLPAVGKID